MENIKCKDLYLIGIELLRKNNESFYKSKLSDIMQRIFIAANKDIGITSVDDEYYMKSGTIPDRVYYIYSEKLNNIACNKIFDIVIFKNKPCIWFYSKNTLDTIGKDPVDTIMDIYDALIHLFKSYDNYECNFIYTENIILKLVYCIGLIYYIDINYGLISLEQCKEKFCNMINLKYTDESILKFIDHVIENINTSQYFDNKIYLESYMLLEIDKGEK